MDVEKLIEQLNDWNEKYISNLCGDRTIKCEEYCIKDDCLIVKASTALSTLQAENEKLRVELGKVKAENAALSAAMLTIQKSDNLERMEVVYKMDYATALSQRQLCDVAWIVFRGLLQEDLKWRGPEKED